MSLTPVQLNAVISAERLFYERCFTQLITSVTLHMIAHNHPDLQVTANRVTWIHERAMRCLDHWRRQFVPSRVGMKLETEWPE